MEAIVILKLQHLFLYLLTLVDVYCLSTIQGSSNYFVNVKNDNSL